MEEEREREKCAGHDDIKVKREKSIESSTTIMQEEREQDGFVCENIKVKSYHERGKRKRGM